MKSTFAILLTFSVLATMITAAAVPSHPLVLWYEQPAEKWVQELSVGNGRLGGMIFGGTTNERVQLNDITVWSGGLQPDANRPEAWKHLAEIRRVIREGRYDDAEKQCNQHFTCQANYDVSKFQTLGDLHFAFQLPAGAVTNYTRWLDIDSAVAGVEVDLTWRDVKLAKGRQTDCGAMKIILLGGRVPVPKSSKLMTS